jgi:phosphohistidine swiveling domain-containing protein
MNPLIEDVAAIQAHPHDFGPKTTRLLSLTKDDVGLPVFAVSAPNLVALCEPSIATGVSRLSETLSQSIHTPCIIRSSGLHEDGAEHAHAGQFMSAVAHNPTDIARALTTVITDAQEKLGGLATFSLLIQPYITPQYTGVLFTRDPRGGLMSMMAWSKGATPHVVSGSDSTECVFHRSNAKPLPFSWMRSIVSIGLSLEATYAGPQDIEWIYDGTRVYIVQTRPITTVSAALHDLYIKLEKERGEHIYLERSGPAETYPHPVPLTYSLLSYLYSEYGPIQAAYTQYGVQACMKEPFTQVGVYLYSDKEAELRNFFPSHSYFGGATLRPHVASLRGFWSTYTNSTAFARIDTSSEASTALRETLASALSHSETVEIRSWQELTTLLREVYRVVFSINILAFVAESKLKVHLKGKESLIPLCIAEIPQPSYTLRPQYPQGNSLAVEDSSTFMHAARTDTHFAPVHTHTDHTARELAKDLAALLTLREEARCGSAWCAHHTRKFAERIAETCSIPLELAPYMLFEELESGTAIESLLRERMAYRVQSLPIVPPLTLSTVPLASEASVRIIAHGYARGLVVDEAYLKQAPEQKKEYILFTTALSPDLVKYFPSITGIIATTGSTLSHLAIMAREAGIPVIVDPHATLLTNGTYTYELDARSISPQK